MTSQMKKQREKERKFLLSYYGQLKGAIITDVSIRVDEDEPSLGWWPTLDVRLANGQEYVLEVSQDAEGNGPGMLFGLPGGD